jgi:putative OPT family oligopeptide transporter
MLRVDRIADDVSLPELTLRGIILGALITVVFTASNIYLGLKVGLTFSSAIPAAVISMAVLRLFPGANILENNMVQTQASAAGTLSSIIFILPGLVMLGHWQGFPFWQTLAICAAGGMLGVVFSIPLRHAMVVQSELPYPEGVAAAEILRVGSAAPDQAAPGQKPQATGLADLMAGGLVAGLFSFAAGGLRLLAEGANFWLSAGASVVRLSMGFSLALVGAGYLVGIVGGLAMLLGLVLTWGVAVPWLTAITPRPDGATLSAFGTMVWSQQARFIGAGTIGIAAIWTLLSLAGPMLYGIRASFGALQGGPAGQGKMPRTQQDMPAKWIGLVMLGLLAVLVTVFAWFLAPAPLDGGARWRLVIYAVVFAFIFGFLVAAACGYMAGLVGSSASPISGIGIIAVILVSLLILVAGKADGLLATPEGSKFSIALAIFTTSAVVAVASIANDNLQDLKTGWLVGATPWRQQVALLIGCVVGAAVIPPVLELLYSAYGFAGAGTALQRLWLRRRTAACGHGPQPGAGRAAGDADDRDRHRHLHPPAQLDHDPDRHRAGRGADRHRRGAAPPPRRGAAAGAGGGHRHLPAADHQLGAGGGRGAVVAPAAQRTPPRHRARRRRQAGAGTCRAARHAAGLGPDRGGKPGRRDAGRGDRPVGQGCAAGAGRGRV